MLRIHLDILSPGAGEDGWREGSDEVLQGLDDLSDLRAHCGRGLGGILSPSVYHGQPGCLCAI